MTMDDLGGALGFEGKNMSVRISQYETGARIPGEDMILKLADALHCNYKAISDYSLGAAEDIIETLFWLEESAASLPARGKGTRFPEYTAPGNLIHLTAMTPAKPSETARPTYNEDDYDCAGAPVALTFEYGLVNDFLSELCKMKAKKFMFTKEELYETEKDKSLPSWNSFLPASFAITDSGTGN